MKKPIIILLIILLLIAIQTSVLPVIFPVNQTPNIILMFAVAGTVIFGFSKIWPWLVVSGILLDLFSYSRIGTYVMIFTIASYLTSFFSRRLLAGEKGWGVLIMLFLVFAATIIDGMIAIFYFPAENFAYFQENKLLILKNLSWKVIYNFLIFFASYTFLSKLKKIISLPEYKVDLK